MSKSECCSFLIGWGQGKSGLTLSASPNVIMIRRKVRKEFKHLDHDQHETGMAKQAGKLISL